MYSVLFYQEEESVVQRFDIIIIGRCSISVSLLMYQTNKSIGEQYYNL